MEKEKTFYKELARADVSSSRCAIISECSKGGFTIAQQMMVKENDKSIAMFLKGALRVEGLDELYHLRDAINFAIIAYEEGKKKKAQEKERMKNEGWEW